MLVVTLGGVGWNLIYCRMGNWSVGNRRVGNGKVTLGRAAKGRAAKGRWWPRGGDVQQYI